MIMWSCTFVAARQISTEKATQYRSQGRDPKHAPWQGYIHLGNAPLESEEHLFRALVKTMHGERLGETADCYTRELRELMLQKLADLGVEVSRYGLHSLRAGGATAAANSGVPDRMFKWHGRWKSGTAKDGYVKDSMTTRLEVTKIVAM